MQKKVKGFTLVEMSIVLVVISLIIAVIIQAREVIENMKINRVVKEFNEIRSAFNNFKIKYNAIPGDMSNAQTIWGASNTSNGDGDGKVDKTATTIGESLAFWQQLNLSGVFPGNYSGALSSSLLVPNTNVPASKYSKVAGYTYYDRASGTTYSVYTKLGNVLEFGGCNNSQTNFIYCSGPVIRPTQAQTIDKKIDDGKALTGSLMGTDGYSDSATRVSGCAADYTATSAAYTVATATDACRLFYWLEEPEN